ncbi:aminotransferase-like domain-containing protein [Gluconobacter cerinus]|uniref:aminotransferase-like domain-containing protein n=1 Tax=Gluconobacter cerinus TaxID=38307 RepID=UPI001B8D972F|nr:PLP-dependent aminotransferase family protein [Gluconobacter cerinus]MBS1026486.1 PLP-dependent aminotransferase family protein [Gluconobacter cerinus]MBS1045568.1 PLP-dependent aminotransferase family protein [Gluconobacter cerinus]
MKNKKLLEKWNEYVGLYNGPTYLAIVEALAASIRNGIIHGGERLPTQREIASALDTNLTTVTRAFREAHRRGLINATVGRGTFVRMGAEVSHWRSPKAAIVDMTMNLPPIPQNPPLQRIMQSDLAALLKKQDISNLMSYRVTGGTLEERQHAVRWIEPVIGSRRPDDVLVVPGAQTALAAAMSILASPGDIILTDRITYSGIRTVADQLGIILVGVDGDENGFIPEQLEIACRQYQPKALYCIPAIQNPTTVTMSLARRKDVLKIVHDNRLYVVEDDPYSLLHDNPIPALAALDHGRVIYISTLAKVLSPGLRTAYVALPNAEMTRRFAVAVRAFALTNAGLLSALTLRWMQTGQSKEILGSIKQELRLRQSIARNILGDSHGMDPNGPHVWLKLPEWWSSVDFVSYARHRGIALVPSNVFTVDGDFPQRARISLGSILNISNLENSLHDIVTILSHKRATDFLSIV